MKRLAVILLLVVFLFNIGGYYLLYIALHHRTDAKLTAKIEAEQYSGEQTIELKIPVTLPYPLQENGFERVDGRFEHNGTFYKLVKQKLENDTLYIVCLRDIDAKHLDKTFKDYAAKTNDLPASSKNAASQLGKFLKDFETVDAAIIQHQEGWERLIYYGEIARSFAIAPRDIPGPPPKG